MEILENNYLVLKNMIFFNCKLSSFIKRALRLGAINHPTFPQKKKVIFANGFPQQVGLAADPSPPPWSIANLVSFLFKPFPYILGNSHKLLLGKGPKKCKV